MIGKQPDFVNSQPSENLSPNAINPEIEDGFIEEQIAKLHS